MEPNSALRANPEALDELTKTQVVGEPVLATAPSVKRTMDVARGIIACIKNARGAREMEMGLDCACQEMVTAPFFICLYVEKVSHTLA